MMFCFPLPSLLCEAGEGFRIYEKCMGFIFLFTSESPAVQGPPVPAVEGGPQELPHPGRCCCRLGCCCGAETSVGPGIPSKFVEIILSSDWNAFFTEFERSAGAGCDELRLYLCLGLCQPH